MDWEKYDNLSLEEKETLLSQIKADVYKLEGRIAEKKSIFAYFTHSALIKEKHLIFLIFSLGNP